MASSKFETNLTVWAKNRPRGFAALQVGDTAIMGQYFQGEWWMRWAREQSSCGENNLENPASSAAVDLETGPKKITQDQNLTNNKKSTIFELSSWNLVKMTSQWGGLFDQVS